MVPRKPIRNRQGETPVSRPVDALTYDDGSAGASLSRTFMSAGSIVCTMASEHAFVEGSEVRLPIL